MTPISGNVCLRVFVSLWQNCSILTLPLCILWLVDFEISPTPHSLMLVTWNFGGTLGSLGGYPEITLGHSGVILWVLWRNCEGTLGSLDLLLGLFFGSSWVILKVPFRSFGVVPWGHLEGSLGVTLGLLWDRFEGTLEVTLEVLWDYFGRMFGPTLELVWGHFEGTLGVL